MTTEIQGVIERITYYNEENGYTVTRVNLPDRKDPVTVVGLMHEMNPGEYASFHGEWEIHPKFGEQFKANHYETQLPASAKGIEKFLASGMIKGIGPVMAKRIVKKFGDTTLDIIDQDIRALNQVEGIGKKRVDMIADAWEKQKEIRQVMIFLQTHGISSTYAVKIFKRYGHSAIPTVQENPYRLAGDIFGIGFKTADRIASKLGFQKDAPIRIQAGLLYVLQKISEEGHVFSPKEEVIQEATEILEVDSPLVEQALEAVSSDRRVILEDLSGTQAVYLAKHHWAETKCASQILALYHHASSLKKIDTEAALQWVQKQLSMQLAAKQAEAIKTAIHSKVMIITGGPGTGKTTIIRSLLKIILAKKHNVLLAAPTGRAAKRMSETTGYHAKTIHRMLEFNHQQGGFQRNEDTPLDCDMLIVDEMSMVDLPLMHQLLKAVPLSASLILVGDRNQLPSVGVGQVLQDLMDSGTLPVVELNEIFRQAQHSSIIVNAHRVNQGSFPNIAAPQNELDDFYFIEQEDPDTVIQTIKRLVLERIPQRFHLDARQEIQVLTPMQKGKVGGIILNRELQTCLNPKGEVLTRGGNEYRVGDKIMQLRNNYDKEVFNGDIGFIRFIDQELQEVQIAFEERLVKYDFSELDEITLAYAISIHKSQGSEYPAVVFPLLTQHYVMLQRNLLYTAITRGKKLVVVIGTKKALAIAVRNNKTKLRYTYLKERIQKLEEQSLSS